MPIHHPARSLLLASLTLGLVGGPASLMGCGNPKATPKAAPAASECPEGQTFDGQFCQVTGAPPPEAPPAEPAAEPAPTTADTQAVPGSGGTAGIAAVPTPDPGTAPAAAPSLATPVDVSMAAQAGPLITYMAGSHLPAGARPFGAPFAAQFAEGQVFEQQVKLTLGKCYTVVAAGLPPVSELVLELHAASTLRPSSPAGPVAGGAVSPAPVPLAVDAAAGPQAVLGSRAACIKADRTDVWLLLRVPKGQGVVAGQVFEK